MKLTGGYLKRTKQLVYEAKTYIKNNSALEGCEIINVSTIQKGLSQELGNCRPLNFACTW